MREMARRNSRRPRARRPRPTSWKRGGKGIGIGIVTMSTPPIPVKQLLALTTHHPFSHEIVLKSMK